MSHGFTATRLASQQLIHPVPLLGESYSPDANTGTSVLNVTVVTAGGSPNTKGSWTTVDASTAVDTCAVILSGQGNMGVSGQDRHNLLDFAIGPSGSAVILIENLQVGLFQNSNTYNSFYLPFRIPAGEELIARTQCPVASAAEVFQIQLIEDRGGVPAYGSVVTMGANTSTSQGVVLTTPGGTHTKGAWTEITGSTSTYIRALSWGVGMEWQPGFSSLNYLYDIGYGDSGTETILFENLSIRTATSETTHNWLPRGMSTPVAVDLPSGSRLVGRWQAGGLQQDLSLVLHGWS